MKTRTLPILLALALFLSPLQIVFAQTTSGLADWSSVQRIKTDAKLIVKHRDGRDIKGNMIDASDAALTIDQNGKPLTIARADIRQIYVNSGQASKAKWTALGAGIGAGAGAGIGAIQYSPNRDDSEIYVVMGVLLGTGAGAVGGLLFGQSRRKRELVYSAY